MWNQSRYAWKFFMDNAIPFQDMTNDNTLVSNDNWLLVDKITGNIIVVYLRQGGTATVDLAPLSSKSQFSVQWFDPRNGGRLQEGSIQSLIGGQVRPLGEAPNTRAKDWAVLLRCEKGC
jgi:Putative collagen-binding domain of a collagenase